MEVRKDLGDRVAALAESTPREAIENLLKALLPRVPVQVRAPVPQAEKLPRAPSPVDTTPEWRDPFRKLTRGAKGRKPKARGYRVLNHSGYMNHRMGTWRRHMVEAIVKSNSELEALAYLSTNYPHLADKGVDIAYAESVNYITFELAI